MEGINGWYMELNFAKLGGAVPRICRLQVKGAGNARKTLFETQKGSQGGQESS